jgi:hypothetical protein
VSARLALVVVRKAKVIDVLPGAQAEAELKNQVSKEPTGQRPKSPQADTDAEALPKPRLKDEASAAPERRWPYKLARQPGLYAFLK